MESVEDFIEKIDRVIAKSELNAYLDRAKRVQERTAHMMTFELTKKEHKIERLSLATEYLLHDSRSRLGCNKERRISLLLSAKKMIDDIIKLAK